MLVAELEEEQRSNKDLQAIIAASQIEQGRFNDAVATIEKIHKQYKGTAETYYLLSRAYAGSQNKKGMKTALEKSIDLESKHVLSRLAMARLLLTEEQYEQVEKHLLVLKEIAADNPEVLGIEAMLAEQGGDQEKALKLSQTNFDKSPTTGTMLSLARRMAVTGDIDGALRIQEKWIGEHPDDIPARMALAKTYANRANNKAAIEQYRKVLKTDEGNLAALNDLAWYLRDIDPGDSLEYARRANKIKPDSVVLMDTLAVALLKNGETNEARQVMDKVLLKKPNDPAFRYHSAMIDVAAGRREKARKNLLRLMQEGKDFAEKAEAEKLLVELNSGT
jgi:Flp pilus assembly protein TadD